MPDLMLLAPDFMHLDSPTLARSSTYPGLSMPIYSVACPEPLPSILDLVQTGPATALHSFLCSGSSLLVYGMTRLGPGPLALDHIHLGSILLPQGYA